MSGLWCLGCGEDLTPATAYVAVSAWEKPPMLRGEQSGSSLVLRKPTGQYACNVCITKWRHGVPASQQELFTVE